MRVLWATAGCAAVGLGGLGAFLPLLPTVPFMLLAAYCFSKSSDRLHDWLVEHRIFGPGIRDWRENRAISVRGKQLATLSICLVPVLSMALGFDKGIIALQAIVLAAVLAFIWTRPAGPSKDADKERRAGPTSDR